MNLFYFASRRFLMKKIYTAALVGCLAFSCSMSICMGEDIKEAGHVDDSSQESLTRFAQSLRLRYFPIDNSALLKKAKLSDTEVGVAASGDYGYRRVPKSKDPLNIVGTEILFSR